MGNFRVMALLALWAATACTALTALEAQRGRGQLEGPVGQCSGQIISRIEIHTYPPFSSNAPGAAGRLARFATSLHSTTKPSVVRRYLKLREGRQCTELRRIESERILRAQPFLADADVVASSDGAGGVIIDVVTVDEVSLILDGSGSTKSPFLRGVRLGEMNLAGTGTYSAVQWQHGIFYRDIFKARVVDYQLLGRPYQLSFQGARNEIGGSWDVGVSYPFLTDLQRVSWRATTGATDGYLYFLRPDAPAPALRLARAYADAGGVRAFGRAGQLFLVGASVSRERERTNSTPVLVRDSAIVPDTSTALFNRYSEHRTTRINLLLGLRNVHFLRVNGFDALEGSQDVRTGFELSTLIGKGLHLSDEDDRDYFFSSDVYAGAGDATSFFAIETMGERRRNLDTHRWDGVLASGRAAWYVKPSDVQTVIADMEFSGGWRQRVPFQVTLADREGGIPAFHESGYGGAQRLVARLEGRQSFHHLKQFAALAGAGFIDAGKLWAGDAPFGMTTSVKVSAGVSLLAALPPRSRRMWRMDLAMPLNDRHSGKFEIRFTNHDFTRWFWREPGDVQTSRERSVPNSVYNWP